MRQEIDNAVSFLSNLIRNKNVDPDQLSRFRDSLSERFSHSFTNHWFPEKPIRGNAYRCVRIVNNKMDKLVLAAGADAGLSESQLLSVFPPELSVWIDPYEVSYRIGEDGSVGTVYCVNGNEASDSETDSQKSSRSESRNSTPSPTVVPQYRILVNENRVRAMDSSNQSSSSGSRNSSPVFSSSPIPLGSRHTYMGYQSNQRISPDTVNEAYIIHAY